MLRGGGHRRAEPSPVDGLRAFFGDEAQRVGQVVLHQVFAGGQWDAVRAVDLLRVRGERCVLGAEPGRRLLVEGETPIRVPDSGPEQARPLRLPILLPHRLPGVQVARRGDGPGTTTILPVARSRRPEHGRVERGRCPAPDLEETCPTLFGAVDDDGPVPADAAHHRLYDAQRGGDCHRRVEGVSAVLHDLQTCPRRKRVRRTDHAVRPDRRADRRAPARGAFPHLRLCGGRGGTPFGGLFGLTFFPRGGSLRDGLFQGRGWLLGAFPLPLHPTPCHRNREPQRKGSPGWLFARFERAPLRDYAFSRSRCSLRNLATFGAMITWQ